MADVDIDYVIQYRVIINILKHKLEDIKTTDEAKKYIKAHIQHLENSILCLGYDLKNS